MQQPPCCLLIGFRHIELNLTCNNRPAARTLPSLTLTLTHFLSLFLSLSLSFSLSLSLSFSLSLSRTHTHTLSLSRARSLSLPLSRSLSRFLSLSLPPPPPLPLLPPPSLCLSPTLSSPHPNILTLGDDTGGGPTIPPRCPQVQPLLPSPVSPAQTPRTRACPVPLALLSIVLRLDSHLSILTGTCERSKHPRRRAATPSPRGQSIPHGQQLHSETSNDTHTCRSGR